MMLFLVLAFFISLFFLWPSFQEDSEYAGSTLLVFGLVNLNIILLCVLAFLVGRNVVKLVFDRRRRIFGSKLKLRLVVAAVGLILVPTSILFILASGMVNRAMQGWFSTQVDGAMNGALEVARHHYVRAREEVSEIADTLGNDLRGRLLQEKVASLRDYLEDQRKNNGLFSLTIVGRDFKAQLEVHNATAVLDAFSEPALKQEIVTAVLDSSEQQTLLEEKEGGQFIRTYHSINSGPDGKVLVVSKRIDPEVSQAVSAVNDSYREYQQLKLFRNPLKSGYILTLSLITGLLLFSAIWMAFYLAREIAVPIQRLAEATRYVSKGNYDFQIRVAGDDEIGYLVKSFNRMTADLKSSRIEAEARRRFIETILVNLAVGVIALDNERRVTSINKAAAELLGLNNASELIGCDVSEVLGEEHTGVIAMLEQLQVSGENSRLAEREFQLAVGERELKIVCTVGNIVDARGAHLGSVLLLDDVTEISKAQHMSAWREVAKRIAHEIKNPLTPIQLSAQRLDRLVSQNGTGIEDLKECTQTIVENVTSIKRLANEFSEFARMPTAELRSSELNNIISETIAPFAEANPEIVFQFIADAKIPKMLLDREQIRRVLMNLIDNGVAALKSESWSASSSERPRIVLKSFYDRRRKMASFEVTDNGPGIKPSDKSRIFEPYFTTKATGSGIGLAVVTSIVLDHQGSVQVYDNHPHGAKFIVQLPLAPKISTQRRFASA